MSDKEEHGVPAYTPRREPKWWDRDYDSLYGGSVSDEYGAGEFYARKWGIGSSGYWGHSYGYDHKSRGSSMDAALQDAMHEVCRVSKLALSNDAASKTTISMKGATSPIVAMANAMSSKGKKNHRIAVTLNPEWVVKPGASTISAADSDALCGESLTQASMQLLADPKQIAEAVSKHTDKANHRDIAAQTYVAMERSIASTAVVTEWPGFSPYFKRSLEKQSVMSVAQTEMYCSEHGLKADTVVAVAGCLLNHPASKPRVDEAIMNHAQSLLEAVASADSKNRYNVSFDEVTKLAVAYGRAPVEPEICESFKELKSAEEAPVTSLAEFDSNAVRIPPGCRRVQFGSLERQPAVPEEYKKYKAFMAPVISMLRKSMEFRKKQPDLEVFGCKSGDFDDGAVQYLAETSDRDPAIWQRKEERRLPMIAVGLLLDESGSMSDQCACPGWKRGHASRVEQVTMAAVAIYEALKGMQGVEVCAFGHTTYSCPEKLYMKEYITRENHNPESLPNAHACSNNADGFAMEWMAKRMYNDYPDAQRKIMFVLSDGQPHAEGYGADAAMKHMNNVVRMATTLLGVDIYGLGVGILQEHGDLMYGSSRFVQMDNLLQSISLVASFMKRVCRK